MRVSGPDDLIVDRNNRWGYRIAFMEGVRAYRNEFIEHAYSVWNHRAQKNLRVRILRRY